jgi:hypothetical protein
MLLIIGIIFMFKDQIVLYVKNKVIDHKYSILIKRLVIDDRYNVNYGHYDHVIFYLTKENYIENLQTEIDDYTKVKYSPNENIKVSLNIDGVTIKCYTIIKRTISPTDKHVNYIEWTLLVVIMAKYTLRPLIALKAFIPRYLGLVDLSYYTLIV